MFGIQNITSNNGWAMAAVGASIVFSGLIVLSFVISQIHKVLKLWDDRDKLLSRFKKKVSTVDTQKIETLRYEERHLPSIEGLATTYRPLVEKLKEPFKLSQLFEIAKDNDLPHPHLSIQRLQEAEILVTQGDGTYKWNKEKDIKA